MRLLSRIEEIILLSIWRLESDAYGIAILEEVRKATGKTWLPTGKKTGVCTEPCGVLSVPALALVCGHFFSSWKSWLIGN